MRTVTPLDEPPKPSWIRRAFAYLYPLASLGLIAGGAFAAGSPWLALVVPGVLMWLDFQGVFERFRRAR